MDTAKEIREKLFSLQDETYRAFQAALVPTVEYERIIGVRTPALRKLAKELSAQDRYRGFIRMLPHTYYEENTLHGFMIERIRDFAECAAALDAFLPFVDNWATCDTMSPKALRANRPALLGRIQKWLASDHTYTVRFGIGMLMRHFLDDAFKAEYLRYVADIRSGEYYVNMMRAWFFATALAKQCDATMRFIKENPLDTWTHNKTIQKALESRRIPAERKAYLRTLKRKVGQGI